MDRSASAGFETCGGFFSENEVLGTSKNYRFAPLSGSFAGACVLETGADQVRIEFAKWAISTNETAAENAKAEAKKAQEAKAKAKAAKKVK